MTKPDYARLFYGIRKCEEIRKRRNMGLSREPWTLDLILSVYHICNVQRGRQITSIQSSSINFSSWSKRFR